MNRAGALIFAGVLTATGAAAQEVAYADLDRGPVGTSICPGGMCGSAGLTPLFEALAATEAGERKTPVLILQAGDSHTAGGKISGKLRARLQMRFGYGAMLTADAPEPIDAPGVRLIEAGEVGATLTGFATGKPALPSAGSAVLTILAFGTNDGFDDGLDPVVFEALLRNQVEGLRKDGAAVLILGAPDALRTGSGGGCSADGLRAPPANLAVVRDVQRRVAAELGVAFWDWHGRMGGDCSADRLALRADPFMRGDRVHFTAAGADWIGGVLADDLLAAYDAWKASQGPGSIR
ncbi:hypothetical protein ASC65_16025 [Brevundimonas sp. Root1279]|nr:hypothetical protein ASC65_16025 [Brevundimonas sp. Root1279]